MDGQEQNNVQNSKSTGMVVFKEADISKVYNQMHGLVHNQQRPDAAGTVMQPMTQGLMDHKAGVAQLLTINNMLGAHLAPILQKVDDTNRRMRTVESGLGVLVKEHEDRTIAQLIKMFVEEQYKHAPNGVYTLREILEKRAVLFWNDTANSPQERIMLCKGQDIPTGKHEKEVFDMLIDNARKFSRDAAYYCDINTSCPPSSGKMKTWQFSSRKKYWFPWCVDPLTVLAIKEKNKSAKGEYRLEHNCYIFGTSISPYT